MHSDTVPTWSIPDELVDRLADIAGPGWTLERIEISAAAGGDGASAVPARLLESVAEAEIYFGFGVPEEIVRVGTRLRWVHSGAAGVRSSLSPSLIDSEILFTNSAGVYGPPLAEWAIGAMLYFARGFDIAMSSEDPWPYDALAGMDHPLRELDGSRLAVVGYGGIGREIARRAAALGMSVSAVRAHPDAPYGPELGAVFGPDRIRDAVADAHFVVLALPETAETVALADRSFLAAMRSDAVLMNVSRGSLVDEPALIDALRGGRLRGAALDVFASEPLPDDSGLLELPNLLRTPHTGSVTRRFWERQGSLLTGNLARYLRDEPLENLVDKRKGY